MLGLRLQLRQRPPHSQQCGIQDVYLVYLLWCYFRHSPCPRFPLYHLAEGISLARRHLLGVVQPLQFRQPLRPRAVPYHRRGKHAARQRTPACLIAAGFQHIRYVVREQHG